MSGLNLMLQSIFGAGLPMGAHPMYQHQGIPQEFKRKYHAYSPAYWSSDNREKLEQGDKIVLPASALEELSRMHVQFPIMFEIAHDSEILPKKSHCSVMEFTAPEGAVYLPLWMIDNLGLDPQGDSVVELTTVTLPKGSFVQFQAHETRFAMLPNPRVVLEKSLRSYSCLTVGDTIQIQFGQDKFKLDVTEVRPNQPRGNTPAAISIIETDINVDFKEPRDYKEWQKTNQKQAFRKKSAESKVDEEEEDDDDSFGKLTDPKLVVKSAKNQHFQSLEESGYSPQTVKKTKKKSPSNASNNANSYSNSLMSSSYSYPSSQRGAPLGVKKKNDKSSKANVDFLNGNVSMGHLSKSNIKKEEEIVGSMRYIYEIDEHGHRTLVRRLPIRKLSANTNGTCHSLK